MKKKLLGLIIGALSISILTACSVDGKEKEVETPGEVSVVSDEMKEKDKKIMNLQEELESLKGSLEYSEQINKDYETFMKSALEYLAEDELEELAKAQFKYSLLVNEKDVPENGVVEVEEGPVEIKLRYEMATGVNYPSEIYSLGDLSGEYSIDHLDFLGKKEDDLKVLDGTIAQAYVYTFGKEEPEENLGFKVSKELKDRLDLDTTDLKVIRKK